MNIKNLFFDILCTIIGRQSLIYPECAANQSVETPPADYYHEIKIIPVRMAPTCLDLINSWKPFDSDHTDLVRIKAKCKGKERQVWYWNLIKRISDLVINGFELWDYLLSFKTSQLLLKKMRI